MTRSRILPHTTNSNRINGYNYALYNPHVGNQIVFPVPTGIVDLNGPNTIALSIWNQDDEGGTAAIDVGWKIEYIHETGYDFGFDARALSPGWHEGLEVWA